MSQPASNVTEFSVSELAFALKRTVEENYEHVRVRGEISGFKGAAGSGHCYFRLKDDRACLEAVIWKTTLQRLRFKPQEGLEMVATGKLTTYPGRSNYQIVVESLEPAGEGALMALLEERRRKLQAEGLFDAARKKPIPYLPRVIGVVTSPTGAVIRDILHRLRDRFPSHVLVWPVRVQGEGRRRGGRRRSSRLQHAPRWRPGRPARPHHRSARRWLDRGSLGLQRGSGRSGGGGERHPDDRRCRP
jgi:exodeoxyribonuclease VII large subunit